MKLRRLVLVGVAVVSAGPAAGVAQAQVVYVRSTYEGQSDDLFTVRLDGSGSRRLTRGRAVEGSPQWSPGRARIAFHRYGRDGNSEIWVMDADGSDERRLTTSPRDDLRPQWSPDGRWLTWFHAPREEYVGQIRMMRPDGSGKRVLARRAAGAWDWSPDGTKVAFARRDRCSECSFPDYEVNVVDVSTRDVRRVTRNRRTNDGGPVWSPDGRRLAFVREPLRKYPRLYTMRSDGSRQRKLTVVTRTPESPEWSPDGHKIVFGLRNDDILKPERVVMIDVSTGKRRLVSDTSYAFALWSEDGRRIAYSGPAWVDGKRGFAISSIGRDLKRRRRILGSRQSLGSFDW